MKRSGQGLDPHLGVVNPYVPKRNRKDGTAFLEGTTAVLAPNDQSIVGNASSNQLKEFGSSPLRKIQAHRNAVTCVSWNPSRHDVLVTASLDSQVICWDARRNGFDKKRTFSEHKAAVKDARWLENGARLLTASFDKSARLTDLETGSCLQEFQHADLVTCVLPKPTEESIFLTGTHQRGVYAWDIRASAIVREYHGFFGQVQDLLFLPDDGTFISSAEPVKRNSIDKAIVAWDFRTTAPLPYQIYPEPYTCTALRLHPDRDCFLAHSSGGYIAIFSCRPPYKLNKCKRFEGHQSGGYHIGLDISQDGRRVACGDSMGKINLHMYHSSCVSHKAVPAFATACLSVAFHRRRHGLLACGSWDGQLALYH